MSQFSVAIISHDAEVGQRMRHCLELLGIPCAVRAPGDRIDEPLIFTNDADLSPSDGQVRLLAATNPGAQTGGPGRSTLTLAWPPRHYELIATLADARALLGRGHEAAECVRAPNLVGASTPLQQVKRLIGQVAPSDTTVLITGESGTGKEVVARTIHRASARAGRPFVPVNCGAIPVDLLESELFGHEKGAFTGALDSRAGRFELAHGGTLFLDEIGDMPLPMQVKLLRAIQDKSIERIGSVRSTSCDVRIIAATHQDLEAQIEQGRFREDLYYRLAVFPVHVPALRERPDDVEAIGTATLARLGAERPVSVALSADVWETLRLYSWPGNVRELCNLMERLAVQFPGQVIRSDDLPGRIRAAAGGDAQASAPGVATGAGDDLEREVELPVNGIDLRAFLADMECRLIKQALDDAESIVARAADRLHIRRTTLVEKMRKYGIRREVA